MDCVLGVTRAIPLTSIACELNRDTRLKSGRSDPENFQGQTCARGGAMGGKPTTTQEIAFSAEQADRRFCINATQVFVQSGGCHRLVYSRHGANDCTVRRTHFL